MKQLFLLALLCFSTLTHAQLDTTYRNIPKTNWQIQLPVTYLEEDLTIPGFRSEPHKMVVQVHQMILEWEKVSEIFVEPLAKSKSVKQKPVKIDGYDGWYEQITVDSAKFLQYFTAPWLSDVPATLHFMVLGKEKESLVLIGAYPVTLPDSVDIAFEKAFFNIKHKSE